MTLDEPETIELHNILFEIKNNLDSQCIQEIEEYINYREWGLAYETICVIIKDYKIKINNNLFQKMIKLGKKMEIKSIYLEMIEKFVLETG